MSTHPPSCAPYNPQYPNAFGYQPSLAPGITFTILFGLSAVGHLVQAIRYRTAWQGLFVVGAGCEMLGWIARIAARYCAYSRSMFTMQISDLGLRISNFEFRRVRYKSKKKKKKPSIRFDS
ncbi:hypothetical protein HYFRA_00013907 [Hymenoscyphus fraxineus]|uniref:RTA1 domain protein n=1 Tax=Hymenoscyphus fraxineus TaxID=746836 RepID=A0A9N9LC07_9HELO|nr:hypothetical protein HYFRA_00013907 [Hymenoscyphus fraxineus]